MDLIHIQDDFLFKKTAVAYLKKEFNGLLGKGVPSENFLQVKFDISQEKALKTLGRVKAADFITISETGISVNTSEIVRYFSLKPENLPSTLQGKKTVTFDLEELDSQINTETLSHPSPGAVHQVLQDSGLGEDEISFCRPEDDNSVYNSARSDGTITEVPLDNIVHTAADGSKFQKFLVFPEKFASRSDGSSKVGRTPKPISTIDLENSSIPLYGKLKEMLSPSTTKEKQRWNIQLLIADDDEAVAGKVWGNTEEQLIHYQRKLVIGNYYILYPYQVADKVYGKALTFTHPHSFNLNHYDKLIPLPIVERPIDTHPLIQSQDHHSYQRGELQTNQGARAKEDFAPAFKTAPREKPLPRLQEQKQSEKPKVYHLKVAPPEKRAQAQKPKGFSTTVPLQTGQQLLHVVRRASTARAPVSTCAEMEVASCFIKDRVAPRLGPLLQLPPGPPPPPPPAQQIPPTPPLPKGPPPQAHPRPPPPPPSRSPLSLPPRYGFSKLYIYGVDIII